MEIAEEVEGDTRGEPARTRAAIFQLSARGTRVQAAADDSATGFIENHRQHAVEGAGQLNAHETEIGEKLLRVEADQLESQPLSARRPEVQHRFLQNQPPAHERPFAAFDL